MKLGKLLFVLLLSFIGIIEFLLLANTYFKAINTYVDLEIEQLAGVGYHYENVLIKNNFDDEILYAMDDQFIDKEIVILKNNQFFYASNKDKYNLFLNLIPKEDYKNDQVINDDLKNSFFIYFNTYSYEDDKYDIFVFSSTNSALNYRDETLKEHLYIFSAILLAITFFSFALTKLINTPIVDAVSIVKKIRNNGTVVEENKKFIYEINELSNEISILSQELDYVKNERKRYLSQISHDLRTPLTYIQNYVELIRFYDISNDECQNYMKIIADETKRIIKILTQLEYVYDNNFYQSIMNPKETKLGDLINVVCKKIEPMFASKEMQLKVIINNDAKVFVDKFLFEQMLYNVLENSYKYSKNKTKVIVSLFNNDDKLFLSIKDQGIGIDSSEINNITEHGYQVNTSNIGEGYGLNIVSRIIELHGWDLYIKSEKNKGTEILIRIQEWKK